MRIELDVAAEVEFVGDIVQVAFVLGLPGKMLFPVPLLQQLFPKAVCVPHITPLAADASTRRYFRLRWEEPTTGCPTSCVMMVCAPWQPQETPDFLAVGRHLRRHGVRVPEVYGVAPLQGLMCLEDYGDCTLAKQWQESTPAERLVWGQRAIDELVKMHTAGTQHHDPACPAFTLAFDVPKLLSELQYFREHAIEGLWHQELTPTARLDLDGDEVRYPRSPARLSADCRSSSSKEFRKGL